ncbi:MAG: cobyric acid synthase [Polyangiaceae bacterium]
MLKGSRLAPALMVQGTASSAGKSLLVTALCRLFRQDGLRVLPFKAQNMALNSAVTSDGGEIGRAQAVQAEAAGVPSLIDMNPVLLKPEGDSRSQVIVRGQSIGSMSAVDYHAKKPELRQLIRDSLARLRQDCDLLVIEGAGSPAEINLKDRDIVNMSVAHDADAKVLLVGDIDRGGVFASFVGTMELLDPDERARIGAFVINKFRGDVALLRPGLDMLTARTNVPVLGVMPYLRGLRIADEDSLSLDDKPRGPRGPLSRAIDIAVVRLPRMANYDDFDPLAAEENALLRFVERPEDLEPADLVILPGSKSTLHDLAWLRESGFAAKITARAERGEPIVGVCGGCQMLGLSVEDPLHVESNVDGSEGLGLLPIRTRFEPKKLTAQVTAHPGAMSFLANDPADAAGTTPAAFLSGYEIHMGMVSHESSAVPAFRITLRNGTACDARDGGVSRDGNVVGTLIHGIFENASVRRSLFAHLAARKGLTPLSRVRQIPSRDESYDRLAAAAREHLDASLLRRLAGLHERTRA